MGLFLAIFMPPALLRNASASLSIRKAAFGTIATDTVFETFTYRVLHPTPKPFYTLMLTISNMELEISNFNNRDSIRR